MGLAASQARYLTLTARKSDLEYQSQTINSRRIQLSYKSSEIARAYSEGMNNKMIKLCTQGTDTNGNTTKNWKELTFSNLEKAGYMLIGTNGSALKPNPYTLDSVSVKYHHLSNQEDNGAIDSTAYAKLSAEEKKAYVTGLAKSVPSTSTTNVTTTTGTSTSTNSSTGSVTTTNLTSTTPSVTTTYSTVGQYVLRDKISDEDYKAIASTSKVKSYFDADATVEQEPQWIVNKDYNKSENAMDIQSLLVSGKAQIVTKDFFNHLVNNGAYDYSTGIQGNLSYKKLLDQWEEEGNSISVVDWRSDESETFMQKNYTEDDADVQAKYEAATAEIQAQDKILEMEEKNIETQHKAIETELENIKKVVQKNIEDTFKIFS